MAEGLRDRDIIVAPTRNAAETIRFIYPVLSSYIRVVNHPIRSLADFRMGKDGSARNSYLPDDKYLVVFSRIHPDKLLHRAIEAIDILKNKGKTIKLLIAGRLTVEGGNKNTTYAAILTKKVEALGLVDDVRFLSEIRDPGEKADYLRHSVALLNLSVTLEESFGKSIVEALSVGTPVIATKWNGFDETVGRCGVLVPVVLENGFADISSDFSGSVSTDFFSKSTNFIF
jgi:glycosyltransferase involved in cell wall biosynthesis